MARYKAIDTSPRFLAVDLEKPLMPGRFEYAVHHRLDREFDLYSLIVATTMTRAVPAPTRRGGGLRSFFAPTPKAWLVVGALSGCAGNRYFHCAFGRFRTALHPLRGLCFQP